MELAAKGIRVLRAVPDNAFMASADRGVEPGGWGTGQHPSLGVAAQWVGWMDRSDKLSPALEEAAPGYVVIFHDDVDMGAAAELVEAAGLERLDRPGLLPHQMLVTGPSERISEVAEWDEVAYIFPASRELLLGSPVVACAGGLTGEVQLAEYAKVGRGWTETNGAAELAYVFASLPGQLSDSTVRSEVSRAFEEWARYAPINFTAGWDAAAPRTIAILFARGAHGDAYPFDGPGKVLAHTFFPAPPNAEPQAGDMHFDDDESWNVGRDVDLFTVALHEAGHALGLGHSDRPDSVMYPYYRLATGLTADDIAGIRELYGSRDNAPPATPQTPAAPPTDTPSSGVPPSGGTPPSGATPPSGGTPPAGGSPGPPDATPPAVKIISPAFTISSTSAPTMTARGTASDNVGVTSVKWSTSGGASGTAAGTDSWTAADIPLLTGTNTVTFRAFDAAGNSSWRSITVVRK